MGRIGGRRGGEYVAAADARPGDFDQDVVGGLELWDRAVLVLELALLFEDEGEVLGRGLGLGLWAVSFPLADDVWGRFSVPFQSLLPLSEDGAGQSGMVRVGREMVAI